MNQEINNKIKLISEMLSIYQNTVLKESDLENLKLIKKDINNKKIELEEIKRGLNNELNTLYENGANEIDPEINQLQIVINEVNELLEEIVPDILLYIKLPNSQKDNVVQIKKAESKDSINEKQVSLNNNNEKIFSIGNKNEENQKANIHIEDQKNEKDLENFNKKIKKEDNKSRIKVIEVEQQNNEVILSQKEIFSEIKRNQTQVIPIKEELTEEKKDNIVFEEIPEEELYMAPRRTVDKNIKKSETLIQDSNKKTTVNFDSFKENQTKKVEMFNTIIIKQPSDNYRNVASNIVSNRLKNFNSPENAIQKAHNAAESVMNNIMENWKNNNN